MKRAPNSPLGDFREGERLLMIAARLFSGDAVCVDWIREEFDVSKATAKRDMMTLKRVYSPVRDHNYDDTNRAWFKLIPTAKRGAKGKA